MIAHPCPTEPLACHSPVTRVDCRANRRRVGTLAGVTDPSRVRSACGAPPRQPPATERSPRLFDLRAHRRWC